MAEATGPFKERVAQEEAHLPYGVQQHTIYAVKRQIEEIEGEHEVICAPIRERLTELSRRIEEMKSLTYVKGYLKGGEKEAMAKQRH